MQIIQAREYLAKVGGVIQKVCTATEVLDGYVTVRLYLEDGVTKNGAKTIKAEDFLDEAYFLVGIDGTTTPDPRYWYDRWEWIVASNNVEARDKWIKKKEGWLREDEIKHVEVFAVMHSEDPNFYRYHRVYQWLEDHRGFKV